MAQQTRLGPIGIPMRIYGSFAGKGTSTATSTATATAEVAEVAVGFQAEQFHLRAALPGNLAYTYNAGADTLSEVIAPGYFNNITGGSGFVSGDLIFVQADDGNMFIRVAGVLSGAITVELAGGDLPIDTFSTGTSAALNLLSEGFYEVGTSIATATRSVLPTPYPGAEVIIRKVDSGTQSFEFDAGASASGISEGSAGGTGVVYDSISNRRITLRIESEGFHVVGTSTTRWRLNALEINATNAGIGASLVLSST